MKTLAPLALFLVLIGATPVRGQSITVEADVTGGYSTDEVSAIATQLRGFGDLKAGVRYYLEIAWATRSEMQVPTDAFGAAYPYGDQLQVIETYGERTFRPGQSLISARAGRFRTPFGISTRSDHAYSGFLRAPLIRYDGYFALSNNFLENGADVIVGVPQLYFEASFGAPGDVGDAQRRNGLDTVLRTQGYYRHWIVGVSHIKTQPYQPIFFARGDAEFTGVDVRWAYDGFLVRGEWITGRPFDGTTTDGWYADLMIHRVFMGPVTAVARVERLDYDTPVTEFIMRGNRETIGAKVRLPRGFTAQVNLLHQSGSIPTHRPTTLDIALGYSVRLH